MRTGRPSASICRIRSSMAELAGRARGVDLGCLARVAGPSPAAAHMTKAPVAPAPGNAEGPPAPGVDQQVDVVRSLAATCGEKPVGGRVGLVGWLAGRGRVGWLGGRGRVGGSDVSLAL